jgi:hypothetical protein
MDEKNGQVEHRRMVAGRGILRNLGKNINSPATGLCQCFIRLLRQHNFCLQTASAPGEWPTPFRPSVITSARTRHAPAGRFSTECGRVRDVAANGSSSQAVEFPVSERSPAQSLAVVSLYRFSRITPRFRLCTNPIIEPRPAKTTPIGDLTCRSLA